MNFILYILLLYFVPLTSIIYLSLGILSSWSLLTFGFLISFIGSLTFFIFLKSNEKNLRDEFTTILNQEKALRNKEKLQIEAQIANQDSEESTKLRVQLEELQKKQEQHLQELAKKQEDLRKFEQERDRYLQKIDSLQRDLKITHESSQTEIASKVQQTDEWKKVMTELQTQLQKKEETIEELELKIKDLNYEVKTLIQLTEIHIEEKPVIAEEKPHTAIPKYIIKEEKEQIETSEEAGFFLKRCVDIAQKLSGTSHFLNPSARFRDLHMDNYAMDLRRLYDNLSSETQGTVFIYSQKDHKILFVNEQSEKLLGYSPENFIQSFPQIFEENHSEWQKGILNLTSQTESKISLQIKNKSGQKQSIACHFRSIPSGIFRHNIIGVLYKANSNTAAF